MAGVAAADASQVARAGGRRRAAGGRSNTGAVWALRPRAPHARPHCPCARRPDRRGSAQAPCRAVGLCPCAGVLDWRRVGHAPVPGACITHERPSLEPLPRGCASAAEQLPAMASRLTPQCSLALHRAAGAIAPCVCVCWSRRELIARVDVVVTCPPISRSSGARPAPCSLLIARAPQEDLVAAGSRGPFQHLVASRAASLPRMRDALPRRVAGRLQAARSSRLPDDR